MLSADVAVKSTLVPTFGLVSSGTLSWALSASWHVNWSVMSCSENYSTGGASKFASSCEAEFVVWARLSCSALAGSPPVAERFVPSKITISLLLRLANQTLWIFFFVWVHLKGHIYAVPPRTTEDIVAYLTAATTVDAEVLRRVWENVVRRTAFILETGAGRFRHL